MTEQGWPGRRSREDSEPNGPDSGGAETHRDGGAAGQWPDGRQGDHWSFSMASARLRGAQGAVSIFAVG